MPPKQMNGAIVVEKTGTLKLISLKEYNKEELHKKCGFKTDTGFEKQTEWKVNLNGETYYVSMYGKLEGRANMENKYDFPPPIDTQLFFGSCLLVGEIKTKGENGSGRTLTNLTISLWDKIYEKLFGGFEDLTLAVAEDDNEEDELDHIPKSKKTKSGGYLKDGFVVDSDGSGDEEEDESEENDGYDDESSTGSNVRLKEEPLVLEDIGSELSEEPYEYSDDEE